jgi:hypothetical protein
MTFDHDEIEHICQSLEAEGGSAKALRRVVAEFMRFRGKVSAGLVRAPVEDVQPWEPKPMPPAVLLKTEE